MSFNNSMTSSSVRRSGSCRKLSSIPPRVQSRCVRSFRVSCFNWCCNAFSSLMAFRSFFSLFSSSRLSFSSFEVSGKGSILLSRYQHINPVWFSNSLTHPHDKSGGFQFIQRTLDRHGAAGQDCGNGCDREADKQDSVLVLLPFGEHSVQHPAVHDLCGAADWKSCQRSGKGHTGRQWCVYRHKFKIHSVCSSFFFARLDK